jgi:uncharacterized protein (DUF1800 family)
MTAVDYNTDIRFGYGAFGIAGRKNTLDFPLTKVDRYPDLISTRQAVPTIFNGIRSYSKLIDKGDQNTYRTAVTAFANNTAKIYTDNALARLTFSTNSEYSFFERLVYFWQNHFSIGTKNKASYILIAPGFENEAIRPYIDKQFSELLVAAVLHPGILITLDQNLSMGPNSPAGIYSGRGINENLGREILELHTLGTAGGYSQADVEELSNLLTGLRVNVDTGETFFDLKFSEPGKSTVLGKSYGGLISSMEDIKKALVNISKLPQTAEHICWKLAKHFISDTPPPKLVSKLIQVFLSTDGHLPSVYNAMIQSSKTHPRFTKIKNPLDFVISGIRAFGIPDSALANVKPSLFYTPQLMAQNTDNKQDQTLPDLTVGALNVFGHKLWGMPGPDGWPDNNEHWLNANGLAKRLAWAQDASRHAPESAQSFIATTLSTLASNRTRQLVDTAENDQAGVILTLMSPEFNRR